MAFKKWREAAEANVTRHLGDVCTADDDPETLADEAYTIAYDGAIDAGADQQTARAIGNVFYERYS